MPAVWIILRSPRERTAFSENSSDPGDPAGQWRLSTSPCSTRLMRSSAVTRVTPEHRLRTAQCPWTRRSARPRATLWRRCFHRKRRLLMRYLAEDLAAIHNAQQRANGIDLGQRTAAAILAMRLNDGSQIPEPTRWRRLFSERSTRPLAAGSNQLDPARLGRALGRVPSVRGQLDDSIPRAASARYDKLCLHGCVQRSEKPGWRHGSAQRTEEQTFIGTFWAYDGTPSLCAPPRLYNQITVQIADQRRLSAIQFARLLALVNVAMADAGMTIWESKYHYDFWRPDYWHSRIGSGYWSHRAWRWQSRHDWRC